MEFYLITVNIDFFDFTFLCSYRFPYSFVGVFPQKGNKYRHESVKVTSVLGHDSHRDLMFSHCENSVGPTLQGATPTSLAIFFAVQLFHS